MKNNLSLTLYTFGHFAADFASAYIILHALGFTVNGIICIVIYNFCAFVLQLPIGLAADKTGRFVGYAMVGCIVISASAFITSLPILCALLCGVGNALYHVGGGGAVLNTSRGITDAGIFVSSGALGLYLGRVLSNDGYQMIWALIFIVITFIMLTVMLQKESCSSKFEIKFTKTNVMATVCIFAVTLLRSYVGLSLAPKIPSGVWAIAMTSGIVMGKAMGGIFADKVTCKTASFISLTAAAVMYIFSDRAVFGILAIFFFNMTMPITLGALARIFNGAKAFAFGVLTVALFIGFLPYCFNMTLPIPDTVQFITVCILSLILILRGLKDA